MIVGDRGSSSGDLFTEPTMCTGPCALAVEAGVGVATERVILTRGHSALVEVKVTAVTSKSSRTRSLAARTCEAYGTQTKRGAGVLIVGATASILASHYQAAGCVGGGVGVV